MRPLQISMRIVGAAFVAILITACPARGQNMAEEKRLSARKFTFSDPSATLQDAIAELAKQTGLEVDISEIESRQTFNGMFNATDFWVVLDQLAKLTSSRVVVGRQGKAVRLTRWNGIRAPVAVDGPFRIEAKDVMARIDLLTGKTIYDLTLEIAWEANLPVYRLDAQPRITKGEDDAGRAITSNLLHSRIPISGTTTTVNVRLEGLVRASKRIAFLEGTFNLTAAEEMLRFTFDDITKAAMKKDKGVVVELLSFTKYGAYWIADVHLHYPANSAVFESFETYWLSRNRFTLIAPDGKTKFTTEDVEINGTALRYRFKEGKDFRPVNLKEWKAEYETPGVLREAPVRFELKEIALP